MEISSFYAYDQLFTGQFMEIPSWYPYDQLFTGKNMDKHSKQSKTIDKHNCIWVSMFFD